MRVVKYRLKCYSFVVKTPFFNISITGAKITLELKSEKLSNTFARMDFFSGSFIPWL